MNPDSKNEDALQRRLLRSLARGGWRTANELARRTGRPARDVGDALLQLRDRGRTLAAVAPVRNERDERVFFHSMTPDSQALVREPFLVPITRLPWPLMKSMVAKLEHRHRMGLDEDLPGWLKAVMVLEEHLDRMGLRIARPRPDLGFPYPCEWSTDHNEGSWNPPLKEYRFIMTFSGTLGHDLTPQLIRHPETRFPLDLPVDLRDWRHDPYPMLRLVLRQGRLRMELDRIAYVTVNRKTFRLEDCPGRDEIVSETKRRLWDATTNGETKKRYLAAFLPFPSPLRVQLLSEGGMMEARGC